MARPEANAGLNVPGCPIPVPEILSNGFFKTYFEAIGEAYHALVLRSVYLAALAAKRQGGDFLEVARNTLRLKMAVVKMQCLIYDLLSCTSLLSRPSLYVSPVPSVPVCLI
ncbi:hypothetical protein MP228_003382 [Amoeboaphelidium protococcarum]|nr:hypothetical protein MP228_003382 [Amoeboaphelidium protococcarum]